MLLDNCLQKETQEIELLILLIFLTFLLTAAHCCFRHPPPQRDKSLLLNKIYQGAGHAVHQEISLPIVKCSPLPPPPPPDHHQPACKLTII